MYNLLSMGMFSAALEPKRRPHAANNTSHIQYVDLHANELCLLDGGVVHGDLLHCGNEQAGQAEANSLPG